MLVYWRVHQQKLPDLCWFSRNPRCHVQLSTNVVQAHCQVLMQGSETTGSAAAAFAVCFRGFSEYFCPENAPVVFLWGPKQKTNKPSFNLVDGHPQTSPRFSTMASSPTLVDFRASDLKQWSDRYIEKRWVGWSWREDDTWFFDKKNRWTSWDTPWRNIIIEVGKIMFLSKWVIWMFHVNLSGCMHHKAHRDTRSQSLALVA